MGIPEEEQKVLENLEHEIGGPIPEVEEVEYYIFGYMVKNNE